ncbi:MAG: ABC transporter permease [Flavobacteriales bacterium]|jgi:lipopolysaccharide transport system permease protein|nr:ABC transporter permease [Flavobacteriales bacterium]
MNTLTTKTLRTVVDARKWSPVPDVRELFAYRDLFLTLTYRDIRVRYAQTMLGLTWALLQPVATLVVLGLVFGRVMRVDTQGVPYALFAVVGIAVWTYFSFVLKESGGSIIGAQDVVRKIYFPRLIIPLNKATVGLVDLFVALVLMAFLFIHYRVVPTSHALYALLFLGGVMVSALGVGIWISALTIRFRDLQHVVPFLVQFGLFATPVAYPASVAVNTLPEYLQYFYFLNPMAGLIEGFRWSLLGVGEWNGLCTLSVLSGLFLFVTGLFYFRSVERTIADLV